MTLSLDPTLLKGIDEKQLAFLEQAGIGGQLDEIIQKARVAWPSVDLCAETFILHLTKVFSHFENTQRKIEHLHLDDLYLACACAEGNETAIAVCDKHFGPEIDRALVRLEVPPWMIEEVRQMLRERLFVSRGDEPPEISTYLGWGRLGGWMRIAAVRIALKIFRKERSAKTDDEEQLAEFPCSPESSPENWYMKVLYNSQFKSAIAQALQNLSTEQLSLLKKYYIDGQNIDQLGETLGIHRSTAARWLERAKRNFTTSIRRTIMQELEVHPSTYKSILNLVKSNLDLSVRLLLDK